MKRTNGQYKKMNGSWLAGHCPHCERQAPAAGTVTKPDLDTLVATFTCSACGGTWQETAHVGQVLIDGQRII